MRKTASQVIAEVAEKRRISVPDLKYGNRTKKLTLPRHEAMFEVYLQCPHLSFPAIAKAFGGFDHSSILHGVRRHCERVGIDYKSLRCKNPSPGKRMVPAYRSAAIPPSFDAYRGAVRYAV